MNVAEQLGANVRRERRRAGLSQEEVSYRLDSIAPRSPKSREGMRLCRIETLAKLAGAIGVEPGVLFEGIVWEPGDVLYGQFVATEAPGLGLIQRGD